MTEGVSRSVTSNQTGINENLTSVVQRHLHHPSQKPFSQHTLDAFELAQQWLSDWQGPLILDSCCGVGESTQWLAKQYPDAKVIGVDKSAQRIGKHSHYQQGDTNHLVLQADLIDFWRLAFDANWRLDKHFLLYPNPYPKAAHLQRRWHGSSAFADILRLQGELTVRSNWQLYVEEFSAALKIAGISSDVVQYQANQAMTPFERKYWSSGQTSWQLCATILPTAVANI